MNEKIGNTDRRKIQKNSKLNYICHHEFEIYCLKMQIKFIEVKINYTNQNSILNFTQTFT